MNQFLQLFIAAHFRIELVVVSDVVPMRASGAGLEDGRRINVRDAQRVQISYKPPRIFKTEAGIELQTVGGKWLGVALLRGQPVKAFRDTARFWRQNRWIGSHGTLFDGTVFWGRILPLTWMHVLQDANRAAALC